LFLEARHVTLAVMSAATSLSGSDNDVTMPPPVADVAWCPCHPSRWTWRLLKKSTGQHFSWKFFTSWW